MIVFQEVFFLFSFCICLQAKTYKPTNIYIYIYSIKPSLKQTIKCFKISENIPRYMKIERNNGKKPIQKETYRYMRNISWFKKIYTVWKYYLISKVIIRIS